MKEGEGLYLRGLLNGLRKALRNKTIAVLMKIRFTFTGSYVSAQAI